LPFFEPQKKRKKREMFKKRVRFFHNSFFRVLFLSFFFAEGKKEKKECIGW
jgi:hypothetical protein